MIFFHVGGQTHSLVLNPITREQDIRPQTHMQPITAPFQAATDAHPIHLVENDMTKRQLFHCWRNAN